MPIVRAARRRLGAVAGIAFTLILASSTQSAGQDTAGTGGVELKDGQVHRGELQGRIVLASVGVGVLVLVDGPRVSALRPTGLELKKGSIVTRIGVGQSAPESVWKMSTKRRLDIALGLADQIEPAEVPFKTKMQANLAQRVDGPGVGSVSVPGTNGYVFFFREPGDSVSGARFVIQGELRGTVGAYTVAPTVRLQQPNGTMTIPADSLSEIVPKP